MAENSKIEWTDHTINWWWGCREVSPACTNCYAREQARRFHHRIDGSDLLWGLDSQRLIRVGAARTEAFRYQHKAEREGRRFRVFTNSMSDFFEDRRDLDHARLEALDVMRQTPSLDWLVLTKRPEKILVLLDNMVATAVSAQRMTLAEWIADWTRERRVPANIFLGTTVEDHTRAYERIPALLQVPAAIHFVSMEPLLGPVNLTGLGLEKGFCPTHDFPGGFCRGGCPDNRLLDWVITGGESGPHARPSHPEWFRSIRDQCSRAGVPYLHKQNGEWGPMQHPFDYVTNSDGCQIIGDSGTLHGRPWPGWKAQKPGVEVVIRHGKQKAGRLLDGVLHDGYPGVLTT